MEKKDFLLLCIILSLKPCEKNFTYDQLIWLAEMIPHQQLFKAMAPIS